MERIRGMNKGYVLENSERSGIGFSRAEMDCSWTALKPVPCKKFSRACGQKLDELQLVPDLNPAIADLRRPAVPDKLCVFRCTLVTRKGANRGQSFKTRRSLLECDRVDRKQHAKRMNAGRGPDQQPASGDRAASCPANPARRVRARVGDGDLCTDRGAARSVSELDRCPHRSRVRNPESSRADCARIGTRSRLAGTATSPPSETLRQIERAFRKPLLTLSAALS